MSNRFLLDANAFIEPRDRYYAYDICPGYWTALVQLYKAERILSIDRVRDELVPKKKDDWDDIAHWIDEEMPDTFFKKTEDLEVINRFQKMVNWVYGEKQFTEAAKSGFASGADGWIVAYAAQHGYIAVTHEEYNPDVKRRIPIPNLCEEFEVSYVNTFEMLRSLNVKFIQSTKRRRKR